jgi:hypothetical protein
LRFHGRRRRGGQNGGEGEDFGLATGE